MCRVRILCAGGIILYCIADTVRAEKGASLLAKIPIRKAAIANMEDYTPLSSWGLEAFYVSGNQSGE